MFSHPSDGPIRRLEPTHKTEDTEPETDVIPVRSDNLLVRLSLRRTPASVASGSSVVKRLDSETFANVRNFFSLVLVVDKSEQTEVCCLTGFWLCFSSGLLVFACGPQIQGGAVC